MTQSPLPLPLRLHLERHNLTPVRLPGTPPAWAILGKPPTQLLTNRKGRWAATCPKLQTLIDSLSHEQPTHRTQTRRSRRSQKRSA